MKKKIDEIKRWFKRNEEDIYGIVCIAMGGCAAISGMLLTKCAYNKGYISGKKQGGDAANVTWILKLIDAHQKGLIPTEMLNTIDPTMIQFYKGVDSK